MENYVVRIYRRSSENPNYITGVVEKTEKGENKTFNTKEEFYNIFWPALREEKNNQINKKTLEFRKYRRFLIKSGTLVFETTTDIGKIIDICMGGFSFTCPDISIDSKEPFKVGILIGNKNYCTEKITCRVVKNCYNSNNDNIYDLNLPKRYGVKFENLTPRQTSQIRHIIQNFTFGDA